MNTDDELLNYYNVLFEKCNTTKEADALYQSELKKADNGVKKNSLRDAYFIKTKLINTAHAREHDAKLKNNNSEDINVEHYKPNTISSTIINTANGSKYKKVIITCIVLSLLFALILSNL